jgi:lipopolysaccharide transport system ATP-binding protein
MALIELNSVSIDFPIYGVSSRSLKRQLLRLGTGGKLGASDDNSIVIVKALDSVSFTVDHGDRVGLIGHNGSGKSTLLRVLSRIYAPTAGTCHIEGKVSALLDVMLGMDPESTGYENIVLRGIINGLSRKEIQSRKDDIVQFTELGDYLSLPVRTYSTGMQLRLAFGIATAIMPEILILDEIVGTGDAGFMEKAQRRFDEMIKASHIVILASHDLDIIGRCCNKVIWLNAGKVEYFGEAKKGIELYSGIVH